MKIWTLDNTIEKYEMIQSKNFKYYSSKYFDPGFKGKSMIDSWPEIEMETIQQGKKSDAPLCGHFILVFTKQAIEVLKDLLECNAELLPLIHKDYVGQDQLYAVNVIDLRDCVDYDKSEREEFAPNMYGRFTKYFFKPDVVKDAHIFKIKDFPYFNEFYSDEFRERALKNKLRGFRFTEVWNSEKE